MREATSLETLAQGPSVPFPLAVGLLLDAVVVSIEGAEVTEPGEFVGPSPSLVEVGNGKGNGYDHCVSGGIGSLGV